MKKLLSVLCTLAVLTANIQAIAVNAVNDASVNTENNAIPYVIVPDNDINKKDDSNPDLKALASSLGADTDYLKIANYTVFPDGVIDVEEVYQEFFEKCDYSTRERYMTQNLNKILAGGMCVGISILQTLAHNGLISPSDIQVGAENMVDIVNNENVEKILCSYQLTQHYTDFQLYRLWQSCSFSTEEKLRTLIETAENAMENGKYFTILMTAPDGSHAVTGIGCADGNWTFNDINYNKCILTLDSNAVDENKNAVGFSEKTCIYINTETNQYYVPGYNWSSENRFYLCTLTDDKLLNSKGAINPTPDYDTDLSDICSIELGSGNDTEFFVTKADGTEYEPDISMTFGAPSGVRFGFEGTKIRFRRNDEYSAASSMRQTQKLWSHGFLNKKNAILEMTDNKVSLTTSTGDTEERQFIIQLRLNEGYYNISDPYSYGFTGYASDVYSEITDDGIILGGKNKIKSEFYIEFVDKNADFKEWDISDDDEYVQQHIIISGGSDVLMKFDDNKELQILIDSDDDGVYDTPVEKGDANSDGKIDASDASEILAGYAETSSGQTAYINENIADYNGDGTIDASDASAVLEYYAKISSGQTE